MLTLVWAKNCESRVASVPSDGPPQLSLITTTPAIAAAAFWDTNRPLPWSSCASTSTSLQVGHAALARSRSSAASTVQSSLAGALPGSGEVAPFWLTIFRQPLALVHGGRPNWLRYVARSLAALG